MLFAHIRLVYLRGSLDNLFGPLMLINLSNVAGGLATAATTIAARHDGASTPFGLDETVSKAVFVHRTGIDCAAIGRAVDLLAVATTVFPFLRVLLVMARSPLRLEELVYETLGFVGVFGGSRAFGRDKRALSAIDVARFKCDL